MNIRNAILLWNNRNPNEKRDYTSIGKLLYPDSDIKTIRVSIHMIKHGKMKTFQKHWPVLIADYLEVDTNFLFGMPSKHDKDFNKLNK